MKVMDSSIVRVRARLKAVKLIRAIDCASPYSKLRTFLQISSHPTKVIFQ